MKRLTSFQIRQMFLDFFKEKGHKIEASASLVPFEDPSLLWINSGVSTLKKYFDGRVIPENLRIVNAQKCIRTNDIENVGITARHHTFFEMLGNFSIGDYFRKEAFEWGLELLVSPKWFGMDKDKLYVTVYTEDHESVRIWQQLGIPNDRIIKLDGNFWQIGEGPCGPCSEIFYDRGPKYDPNGIGLKLLQEDLENDRYLEIWNIVLSQFNAVDGLKRSEYSELPNKNIDTGMGLERMASISCGGNTNFDTDLFLPIIAEIQELCGQNYETNTQEIKSAFCVIADHIRAVTFAISDGALPSNEGRGYIIRRLIRRSVRFAKKLGITSPFLYSLVPIVTEIMGEFYTELKEKITLIQKIIKNEEERFYERLSEGLAILSEIISEKKKTGSTTLTGKEAFLLYDTFGFPLELTEEYAVEEGLVVNRTEFENEMNAQRVRARNARQEVNSMQIQGGIISDIKDESTFIGYEKLEDTNKIIWLIGLDGTPIKEAKCGETAYVMLDKTPFYAESGGQSADCGIISTSNGTCLVKDVKKAPNGQHLHLVEITKGDIYVNTEAYATVDANLRMQIAKNHTATHLLHQALKEILGNHATQAGSDVSAAKIRFDFSHFGPLTADEITKIELAVNQKIWVAIDLDIMETSLIAAKKLGAQALFGEKYGEKVRVVSIGDYSIELCGGTHVANTSFIGMFKIVSEGGIGAGIRRIEAVTGSAAYHYLTDLGDVSSQLSEKLKVSPNELVNKVAGLLENIKELERKNEALNAKLSNIELQSVIKNAVNIEDVLVISGKINGATMPILRNMADSVTEAYPNAVIVLGSIFSDKVNLLAGVSKNALAKGLHAGEIIKVVAKDCGGKGGGRADLAQAGAKEPNKLNFALEQVSTLVRKHLSK